MKRYIEINDTTGINTPRMKYRFITGWYAWTNMVNTAGNKWEATISEPMYSWEFYEDETLVYNVSVTDTHDEETWETKSDIINRFNNAPVLEPIYNRVFSEATNNTLNLSATDDDGDSLTFTSTGDFTIVSTGDDTAIAYWVPGNDDVGTVQVTFTVTDGIETDTETITIQVGDVNSAPVLDPIDDIEIYEHTTYIQYITGYDPDNQNSIELDDDVLVFGKTPNNNWFRINTFYNDSNESYYGVINFTAYTGHRGEHNFTIYLSDGELQDEQNITLTVGYCGDLDSGNEPLCDSDYESCSICQRDCGSCDDDENNLMAIIIEPRNCLGRNFTIRTYELWNRATCPNEGLIIQDMEVCQNLSNTKLEVFILKLGTWEKVNEYISDENGEITYVPTTEGEFKLVASRRRYPNAYEYLEIRPCIEDEPIPEKPKTNKTTIPPVEEKPLPPPETQPEEIKKPISIFLFIVTRFIHRKPFKFFSRLWIDLLFIKLLTTFILIMIPEHLELRILLGLIIIYAFLFYIYL